MTVVDAEKWEFCMKQRCGRGGGKPGGQFFE